MMKATIYTPSLRHKLAAALHTLASMPAMLATLALPLVLSTSCATEELVDPATPTPGQQVTITATLGSDNGNSKPGTRMGYEPDDATKGLKTTWTADDAFNIVPVDNSYTEGTAQTFTLDTGAGTNTGTFTGTAPTEDVSYNIYYPAGKIQNNADFLAFSYDGQVQTGNDNRDHLSAFHSIRLKQVTDYTTIDFSPSDNDMLSQSSCMKFVLTPGAAITPTKITLASEDGSECFYSNNNTDALVSSLSLGLNEFGPIADNGTITAYMMMSCQTVTLPNAGIIVTVYAEDGSSYTQTITPASGTTLESGKMHTITASSMEPIIGASMTFKVNVKSADLGLDFNIPFPTSGTTPANITVNWGDGKTVSVSVGTTLDGTTDNLNHTYNKDGTYTITITSSQTDETKQQMPDFNFIFNRNNSSNNNKKLSSLDSPLLNTGATNFNYYFANCTRLEKIPEGLFDKNTQVTNFSSCFSGCTALTAIPTGLFDKNTEAKDFSSCFYDCTSLVLNETIFSANTNSEERKNRFSGKAMKFSMCFQNTGSDLTPEQQGKSMVPQLWNYDTATWTTTDCYKNCKASNFTDNFPATGWGTPTKAVVGR